MLAKDIYSKVAKEEPLPDLPPDLLEVLKSFKRAYDSKDAGALALNVGRSYRGNAWGCETKDDLIEVLEEEFSALPSLVKPRMKITIIQLIKNTNSTFKAVVELDIKLTAAGLPVSSFEIERVIVTVKRHRTHKTFLITEISEWDQ